MQKEVNQEIKLENTYFLTTVRIKGSLCTFVFIMIFMLWLFFQMLKLT